MNILSLQKLSDKDTKTITAAGHVDYRYQVANNVTLGDLAWADVLLGYNDELTDKLAKNDSVQWVQAWSAGVDQLPQQLFAQKGITLTNASGVMVPGLAEQIMGEMITWDRKLQHSFGAQLKHTWDELPHEKYQELGDKTLLLLGVGHIGQQVAQLAAAFGMHVVGVRHSGRSAQNVAEMHTMKNIVKAARGADFILNTLPVTTETTSVIDKNFFEHLKDSAVYINYGRGQTNNEADLLEALQAKQIGGAIMDVWQTEPLPKDSPFWKLDNILITPHTGGDTALYDSRIAELVARNIQSMKTEQIAPTENVVDLDLRY